MANPKYKMTLENAEKFEAGMKAVRIGLCLRSALQECS